MYRSSPVRSLNTGYITALDMCEVCTEAVHSVALWTRVTLQLWTSVKYVPKQSIFEHGLHYSFGHMWSMYQNCTKAVHFVALWTRVTLQLWTYVKYVPKLYQSSPFRSTLNTGYITALDISMYRSSPLRSVRSLKVKNAKHASQPHTPKTTRRKRTQEETNRCKNKTWL